MRGVLEAVFSIASYLYFFAIFLVFTAFMVNVSKGNFGFGEDTQYTLATYFPYNIDHLYENTTAGIETSLVQSLIVNFLLLSQFCVSHTVFARRGVKQMLGADARDQTGTYRSMYVLGSSASLHALMRFWQPVYMSEAPLWDFSKDKTWGKVFIGAYMSGVLFLLTATFAFDHFSLFGITQGTKVDIYKKLGFPLTGFSTRLHYNWVRHPIMTGWFIMFLAVPTMTVNHMIFSLSMVMYIHLAVKLFEEPDLLEHFPKEYAEYMETTPSYCPMPFVGRRTIKKREKAA